MVRQIENLQPFRHSSTPHPQRKVQIVFGKLFKGELCVVFFFWFTQYRENLISFIRGNLMLTKKFIQ